MCIKFALGHVASTTSRYVEFKRNILITTVWDKSFVAVSKSKAWIQATAQSWEAFIERAFVGSHVLNLCVFLGHESASLDNLPPFQVN